jgi:hypothetical protein
MIHEISSVGSGTISLAMLAPPPTPVVDAGTSAAARRALHVRVHGDERPPCRGRFAAPVLDASALIGRRARYRPDLSVVDAVPPAERLSSGPPDRKRQLPIAPFTLVRRRTPARQPAFAIGRVSADHPSVADGRHPAVQRRHWYLSAILVLGILTGCGHGQVHQPCNSATGCQAVGSRLFHQPVLIPVGWSFALGGRNGSGLDMDYRAPLPVGFVVVEIGREPSNPHCAGTAARASTGRPFCFLTFGNGVLASFTDHGLEYDVSMVQNSTRPAPDESSALAAVAAFDS